jgi:uncharacterized membrane protein
MNYKIFFVTFLSIFLAELGDKTQLATIAFTADNSKYKWIVFIAAAAALVLTSFLGVFFGHLLTNYVSPKVIKISSGVLFLIIGGLMIFSAVSERPEKKYAEFIEEINNVFKIEKCSQCKKFNDFAKQFSTDLCEKRFLSEKVLKDPQNCENCNTEKLKEKQKIYKI